MPRGTNLIAAWTFEFVEPIAVDVNLFGHGKHHQKLFAIRRHIVLAAVITRRLNEPGDRDWIRTAYSKQRRLGLHLHGKHALVIRQSLRDVRSRNGRGLSIGRGFQLKARVCYVDEIFSIGRNARIRFGGCCVYLWA